MIDLGNGDARPLRRDEQSVPNTYADATTFVVWGPAPLPAALTAEERKLHRELRAWRASMEAAGKVLAHDLRQGDIILWQGESAARGVLAVEPGSWGIHSCMRKAAYLPCIYCDQAEDYVSLTVTAAYGSAEVLQPARYVKVDVVARATPEMVEQAQARLAGIRAEADQQRAELRDLLTWRQHAWRAAA